MTNSMVQTIATFSIWIGLILLGTFFANKKRKNSFEDYILANRSLNSFLVAFTLLGSYIGGGTLIAVTGQIASQGIVYLVFPIGVALSLFLYGIFAKSYREKGSQQTYFIEKDSPTSLVDRFAREYGESVRLVSAIVVIFVMIAFMSVQLRAGGIIISQLFGANSILSILLVFAIISFYLFLGGARADVYTDFIQIIFVFISIIGVAIFLIINQKIPILIEDIKAQNPELLEFSKSSYIIIIGFLILPVITMHTDVGLQQKLLLAKNDKQAKNAGFLAASIYLFFGIFLVLIAILASSVDASSISPDDIFIKFISSQNLPLLTTFLYIAILSAVTSTIDSEAIVCSTVIINDMIFKKSKKDNNIYLKTRFWTIITLTCGLMITLLPIGLFDFLSIVWITALAAFSVPVCGLIFKKIKSGLTPGFVKWMIIWSVLIVLLYSTYIQIFNDVDDLTKAIIPLALFISIINLILTLVNIKLQNIKRTIFN